MLPETAPTVDESFYRIWMPNTGRAGVVLHTFPTGKLCSRIDIRLASAHAASYFKHFAMAIDISIPTQLAMQGAQIPAHYLAKSSLYRNAAVAA